MIGQSGVRTASALVGLLVILAGCQSGPRLAPPRSPAEDAAGDQAVLERPLGKWSAASFASGAGLVAGTQIEIEFTADGHVRGHGGCNRFFGDFSVEQESQIVIGPFGSTRMACPPLVMEQEGRLLEALQQSESFRVAAGKLELFDADGNTLLVFTRL